MAVGSAFPIPQFDLLHQTVYELKSHKDCYSCGIQNDIKLIYLASYHRNRCLPRIDQAPIHPNPLGTRFFPPCLGHWATCPPPWALWPLRPRTQPENRGRSTQNHRRGKTKRPHSEINPGPKKSSINATWDVFETSHTPEHQVRNTSPMIYEIHSKQKSQHPSLLPDLPQQWVQKCLLKTMIVDKIQFLTWGSGMWHDAFILPPRGSTWIFCLFSFDGQWDVPSEVPNVETYSEDHMAAHVSLVGNRLNQGSTTMDVNGRLHAGACSMEFISSWHPQRFE